MHTLSPLLFVQRYSANSGWTVPSIWKIVSQSPSLVAFSPRSVWGFACSSLIRRSSTWRPSWPLSSFISITSTGTNLGLPLCACVKPSPSPRSWSSIANQHMPPFLPMRASLAASSFGFSSSLTCTLTSPLRLLRSPTCQNIVIIIVVVKAWLQQICTLINNYNNKNTRLISMIYTTNIVHMLSNTDSLLR